MTSTGESRWAQRMGLRFFLYVGAAYMALSFFSQSWALSPPVGLIAGGAYLLLLPTVFRLLGRPNGTRIEKRITTGLGSFSILLGIIAFLTS